MSGAAAALREAAARLCAVSDTPRLDAELLMAHAATTSREELILSLHRLAEPEGFAALLERRLGHEPVAQITGHRDFWTLTLKVTADVLTPRADSETLLDTAVAHFGDRAPARILDLGTGSGALLLAALDQWRDATGLGIDISEPALAVARANARALNLADRAGFRRGDWGTGIDERFDLILANPPYIATGAMLPREVSEHEPHLALYAGADGLDACRVLAGQIGALLAPGGLAAIEIGFDQGESASALFAARGVKLRLERDLAGRVRCLAITAG